MQVSLQAFKNWVYADPSQAGHALDQATTLFSAFLAAEGFVIGRYSLSKKTICILSAISLVTAFFLVYTRKWIAQVEQEQSKKSEKGDDKGNLYTKDSKNAELKKEDSQNFCSEGANTVDMRAASESKHSKTANTNKQSSGPFVREAGEQSELAHKNLTQSKADSSSHLCASLHHCVIDAPLAENEQKEKVNDFDEKGYTRLHHAVIDVSLEEIKSLLQQGADVHAKVEKKDQSQKDNWENTPLHFAARHGRLDVVTLLLEKGCDPLEKDTLGNNSIDIAGFAAWQEIFDILKQKANIKEEEENDYFCWTVFNLAEDGNLEKLKLHMGRGFNIHTIDAKGFTLLHLAAGHGQLDTVKYLVKEGAEKEATTPDNLTPYMLAYRNGWNEVTKFLESQGCSTDLGTTIFIWKKLANSLCAVSNGIYSHRANPSGRDAQGKTALHYLSEPSQVKQILELDQSLATVADQNGNTPLHLVQSVDVLDILCENGALLDAENKLGQTPLNCALEQRNLKIAEALMQRNAKLNATATNEEGEPFLHCFIRNDKGEEGIELLKKLFATYTVDFDLRNSKGETCLYVAADQWASIKMINLLLEQKSDLINLPNHLGRTALYRAYGFEPLRKFLIEKGADLSIKDNTGLTPEAYYWQRQMEIQKSRSQNYFK